MAQGAWEQVKPSITTALESGFDCVLVDRENIDRVRELGKIAVACFGSERGSEDITVIGRGAKGTAPIPYPVQAKPARIGLWLRASQAALLRT